MSLQVQYERRKGYLLNSEEVSKANKTLFKKFLDWEENKLKRTNGLREVDERSYKTLILYIHYFNNLNKWFNGKDWKKLSKKDIRKVYDDLEDGRILKSNGEPIKDRVSYYNKVFKSKPFQMAGKKHIAEEVIEFTAPIEENVRFITEEDFKKIVQTTPSIKYKLKFWLLWDIGENINSTLNLRKRDCIKQKNRSTNEPEYLIVLNKEILKRSRTPRTEPTNYKETVELLDIVLEDLGPDDRLFDVGVRQVEKVMTNAVRITKIICKPKGERPTLKDLRSGMACHLLGECGWTSDEVKGRLGQKPSSKSIDKYITYLALNKDNPKKKIYDSNLSKIESELEEIKEREKLKDKRIENMHRLLENLENHIKIKG